MAFISGARTAVLMTRMAALSTRTGGWRTSTTRIREAISSRSPPAARSTCATRAGGWGRTSSTAARSFPWATTTGSSSGYLEENERLFGIPLARLLSIDGRALAPGAAYRKVQPSAHGALLPEEAWVNREDTQPRAAASNR